MVELRSSIFSYLIKVTLVTCDKSVVQFDSTKPSRFSPGTPVSSFRDTGPIRVRPYWISRSQLSQLVELSSRNKDTSL